MGTHLHNKYEEQFKEDFKCNYYNEFEEKDPEYIPRIEGTELIIGVKVFSFNDFPILTSRISANKEKYYLFDFIKVWQTDVEPDFMDYDEF